MTTKKYLYDHTNKRILLNPILLPVEVDIDYVLSIQPDFFGTNDKEIITKYKAELKQKNVDLNLTAIEDKKIEPKISINKYEELKFNYPIRNKPKKYLKKSYNKVKHIYANTPVVEPFEIREKTYKNLVIASSKCLLESDLEQYELFNYYKIAIYILSNLNEDFYYDVYLEKHCSKMNKKTELLILLRKNNEEYVEDIAKILHDNLYYNYQKRIFKKKQLNYSSMIVNTDVMNYPVVRKTKKSIHNSIQFTRSEKTKGNIVSNDQYIWNQIKTLENKIDDLNKPVLSKNKTK